MRDRYVRRLISTLKCSVCGRRYEPSKVKLLGSQEDVWFLSVFCETCRTTGLIAAVVKEAGDLQQVTELTGPEVVKFKSLPPVSGDDVLDMHVKLRDFTGDVTLLLGSK
ncbi:MAG: hypothetical protein Q7T04_06495 [Dehalococcoidia bacterium]|nr:hypothetical protein [Dehalococcoidia bacterium]